MPHIVEGEPSAAGRRFAVIVSKFNDLVTERLQAGALEALSAAGVSPDDVTIVRVPGAFEIPLAARSAAQTRRYHAVICLGCLIRGETPHFDFIASAVSHALADLAGVTNVPMAFGVLTTNSIEEAMERSGEGRSNKGREAAIAALEMASVIAELARLTEASGRAGIEPS
jgi:6,7-dimethyl-8-ribityllumazine synthase